MWIKRIADVPFIISQKHKRNGPDPGQESPLGEIRMQDSLIDPSVTRQQPIGLT